jgi:ADP-ribosylglycohydrolase
VPTDPLDRATGALVGLALGDALGMPTQILTLDLVLARYGLLDRFHPGPDDHPLARGLPAGHVTDDTDQAMILARVLIDGHGRFDPSTFVTSLQAWEQEMINAGSSDLLGPSTRRALQRIADGEEVRRAGSEGTTNGAAMRITPVGIANRPQPLGHLLTAVTETCRPTHGTPIAIAGAGAVAAAVSAGVEGADVVEAIELAVRAAAIAEGEDVGLAMIIRTAVELAAAPGDGVTFLRRIDREIGTSLATEESVPAALAVAARFGASPWDAARHAATLGGDSDTIAAMAGAVVGACCGVGAVPQANVTALLAANPGLDLAGVARDLLSLRLSN